MLSVASLLNPVKSETRGTRLPSSPSISMVVSSSSHDSVLPSTQSSVKKQKMSKDGAVFTKGKIKGDVNFPPFEDFDEDSMHQLAKFEVYPIGKVQEFCRHIPYNSEKKTFLEKTGRESFEVFQYTFKVPGNDKEYAVMWDYNIGLVRITPFFKCCNYSKTTPAKMLHMNPGLKDITHSITGGALVAQGYWMPYSCALAVCATFCSNIAGALIPIFGPDFPSRCVPPEAPEFSRMIIDKSLIIAATDQAKAFRHHYSSFTPNSTPRTSYSPQYSDIQDHRGISPPMAEYTDRDTAASEASSGDGYFCSPGTPVSMANLHQRWTHNTNSHLANASINVAAPQTLEGPNPWLSAVPRSSGLSGISVPFPWRTKRRANEIGPEDHGYDGEESGESITDDKSVGSDKMTGDAVDFGNSDNIAGGAEKKAAWLLMKLSVKDGERLGATPQAECEDMKCGPRVKRRRAQSM